MQLQFAKAEMKDSTNMQVKNIEPICSKLYVQKRCLNNEKFFFKLLKNFESS